MNWTACQRSSMQKKRPPILQNSLCLNQPNKAKKTMIFAIVAFLGSQLLVASATMLYVGSYSSSIARINLDANGDMTFLGASDSEPNPSWLTFSPNGTLLFAVSEVQDYPSQYPSSGAVSSFEVDQDGSLRMLSTVASGGGAPAHATTNAKGDHLFLSNYCSGTIGVVPISPQTGKLSPPSQVIDHNLSPVTDCSGAHIHEIVQSYTHTTSQSSIQVIDLGLDTVTQYATDSESGEVYTPPLKEVSMIKGSGPRHMVVHPSAPWAFIINELDSTLSALPFDHLTGVLENASSTVSSLPPYADSTDMAGGELQLSRDGRYLYVSNRDISEPNLHRSSIGVFSVDPHSGSLTPVQFTSSRGEHPRHFDLFFDGSLLVVANMNSNNLVSFKVDGESGHLTPPPALGAGKRVLMTTKPTQLLQAV